MVGSFQRSEKIERMGENEKLMLFLNYVKVKVKQMYFDVFFCSWVALFIKMKYELKNYKQESFTALSEINKRNRNEIIFE